MTKRGILWGVIMSLAGTGLFMAIGLIAALFSGSELVYLSSYLGYVAAGSLLAGSFLAGYLNGKSGWLSGGWVGLIVCLVSLMFSLLILPRGMTLWELIVAIAPGTFAAGMAGVCGANVARAKRKKQKSSLTKLQQKISKVN